MEKARISCIPYNYFHSISNMSRGKKVKRKELMKRALSLALCAMMTVGNLPAVTYASDLSPADTRVVSQAEEADETQSAEEAAQAYLKENFIDATDKVITTGGNGVVKSEDGLTYNIGLKNPNGGSINSLRLKYLNTVYKTGWYIDKNNPYISYLVPTKNGSRSIKSRPTSPYSFTATLKLFASDTENSTIDDGTATALATQDFTFILEAAEVEYKMQVAVQDKDKNPITDASITVEKDGWDKVTPASDGSYKMANGASYKLTVKKEGYYSAGVPSAAMASSIAFTIRARIFSLASSIPRPNSQKSSNNEFAQAGP